MNTHHSPSLAAERHRSIIEMLRVERLVRVDSLSQSLEVSAATIRRDLVELEQQGLLRRVHGGAVPASRNLEEPLFDAKASLQAAEKQQIAAAALQTINPSDSIFLDGGSTVLALARMLVSWQQLTVVTNSLRVASLFSGGGPRMILIGGEFRPLSQVFVGALSRPMLEQIHVDTAFMGTIGLDPKAGLTTTDPREALTKELVMQHASRAVLLADSSKFETVSFVRFAGIDQVDTVITDAAAPTAVCDTLRDNNVEIITGEQAAKTA